MGELFIEMPRGDIRNIRFNVTSGESAYTECSEIYFTVKSSTTSNKIIFQKTLSNGDITLGEDDYYHFTILDTDTDNLSYGTYAFDIEILGDGIKQTSVGTLVLTEEVTFASDEGA